MKRKRIKQEKHGLSKSKLYSIWTNIKYRCYNPNQESYKNYGGKGIKMSESWYNSFLTFKNDIGERPDDSYTVERNDVEGDYCKENCRWATMVEQNNNKTNNHYITYNNETFTLSQWSGKLGIPVYILASRINDLKWDIEKAFSTKVNYHKKKQINKNDKDLKHEVIMIL